MTRPAMAAMGLSSQWWTRATKLRMIRRNVSVSPAGDLCSSGLTSRRSPGEPPIGVAAVSVTQAVSLGDAGIGANLVLLTAGGAGNANRTDHLGAGLDRYAAADRNDVRDLLQIGVLRFISEIL